MQRAFVFSFLVAILLLVSCNNDCQDSLDSIAAAKMAYDQDPSQANCISYENVLNAYLSGTCTSESGVDYHAIFQSYLEDLNCL